MVSLVVACGVMTGMPWTFGRYFAPLRFTANDGRVEVRVLAPPDGFELRASAREVRWAGGFVVLQGTPEDPVRVEIFGGGDLPPRAVSCPRNVSILSLNWKGRPGPRNQAGLPRESR